MNPSSTSKPSQNQLGKKPGTIRRYLNLYRNISNWGFYISTKLNKDRDRILRIRDRKNGVRFEVPRSLLGIFKEIYLDDIYQMEKLSRTLPDSPNVIDIGANVGIFSMRLLSLKPKARVVAYEPIPSNFEVLKRNADNLTHLPHGVMPYQCAVTGEAKQRQVIYFNPESTFTPTASMIPSFDNANRNSTEVDTDTLSSIIEQHRFSRIHLLKLDCEGSEFDIVNGAGADTMARVDAIFLEVHETAEHTIESMRTSLESYGFTVTWCLLEPGIALISAVRSSK